MKICLDAGHGTGQNQSPARCGYFEGDRMFTLQRLLQQELEAYGVTVVCTRAAGRPAALYPRAGGEGLRSVPQPAQQRSGKRGLRKRGLSRRLLSGQREGNRPGCRAGGVHP